MDSRIYSEEGTQVDFVIGIQRFQVSEGSTYFQSLLTANRGVKGISGLSAVGGQAQSAYIPGGLVEGDEPLGYSASLPIRVL